MLLSSIEFHGRDFFDRSPHVNISEETRVKSPHSTILNVIDLVYVPVLFYSNFCIHERVLGVIEKSSRLRIK